ncbi:MAG: 3-phosphoshikimate 1-carboxyvinyltransferase, partial [Caulobacteraceae bacterium]
MARPSAPLRGQAAAPGDKSISHRALILGALARGTTDIEGLLESDDVLRTAAVVAALGADVEHCGEGRWRLVGQGALAEPDVPLDCGNSGTAARLLLGAVAPFPIAAAFTGDASLRSRPMRRVLTPLGEMGARWLCRDGERLPIMLRGGRLAGIDFTSPLASAQVKSAVLLAGLNAAGVTRVLEPVPTRDHTERMLRAFGADLVIADVAGGRRVQIEGGQRLIGADVRVPGDPSSAAFPLVAALIVPGSAVTMTGVLLNPMRNGLIETLIEMGANITISRRREEGGETVGDIHAAHSALRGVIVRPERAASMIDEYPILAVAAAFAQGPTVMNGIGELRVKESDRIATIGGLLTSAGVAVDMRLDGLSVEGRGMVRGGCRARAGDDHRIAMSAVVMGLAAREP